MVFTRFVEVGRVAYIMEGPCAGSLCVIIDVIDQKRGLVHGPTQGVSRQAMNFQSLSLLDFKIRIPRSAKQGTIMKAWEKAEIDKKYQETGLYKRMQQKRLRSSLNDFQRFKVRVLKRQKNRIINGKVKQLKRDEQKK